MKSEKKKKPKGCKSPEKPPKNEEKEESRQKSLEILDQLFEEKTAEEILKLSKQRDVMGLGPLAMVAAMGHVTGVKKLLEAKICVNDRSTMDGETALTLSARSKHVEVVELLLKHDADITRTNNDGDNAFMIAVKVGDPKVVNLLWGYRGHLNINHKNRNLITALHYAAERGWESCVNFLMMQGADVDAQDKNGSTPLIMAAVRGDQKTVEVLIRSAKCNPLVEDNCGCTAVCRALQVEKKLLTEFFLKKFSDQQAENFVKARSERLRKPQVPIHDVAYFYKHLLFPVLRELSKREKYREHLFRHKVLTHAIEAVGSLSTNPLVMAPVSQIVSILMYCCPTTVDERFVLQFIKCGGPDLLIKSLKCFVDSKAATNISSVEKGHCFMPLLATCEMDSGKEWLQKNCLKVTQFTKNFEAWLDSITFSDERAKLKAKEQWTRFCGFFDAMLLSQCEQQEAELLLEVEREKVKREKKREKKKKRRHKNNQCNQEPEDDKAVPVVEKYTPGDSSLIIESPRILTGPLLRDSDEEEEHPKSEPKKSESFEMESLVQKMKSMFAHPSTDCVDLKPVEKPTSAEDTMTKLTRVKNIDFVNSIDNNETNTNCSCKDGESNGQQPPQVPNNKQHQTRKTRVKNKKTGLPVGNDLQDDGKYVAEGFYDPIALVADRLPGQSSWITVGAKKNLHRGQEKLDLEPNLTVTKKLKTKKKNKVDPCQNGSRDTDTALSKEQIVWKMSTVIENCAEGEQVLNYEDEFPSLTSTIKNQPKRPYSQVLKGPQEGEVQSYCNSLGIQENRPETDTCLHPSRTDGGYHEEPESEESRISEQEDSVVSEYEEPIPEWAMEIPDIDWPENELDDCIVPEKSTLANIAEHLYADCQAQNVPINQDMSMDDPCPVNSRPTIVDGGQHQPPDTYDQQQYYCDEIPIPSLPPDNQSWNNEQTIYNHPPNFSEQIQTQTTGFEDVSYHQEDLHQNYMPSFHENVFLQPENCHGSNIQLSSNGFTDNGRTFMAEAGKTPPHVSTNNFECGNQYLDQYHASLAKQQPVVHEHNVSFQERKPFFAAENYSNQPSSDPRQTANFQHVYPTEEVIRSATALCAQQIANLAGLRYQKALIDGHHGQIPSSTPPIDSLPNRDPFQKPIGANFSSNTQQFEQPPVFAQRDNNTSASPLQFQVDGHQEDRKTPESDSSFPEFHTPMPQDWPFARPDCNIDALELVRLEQVRQMRDQLDDPDDVMHNDYQYYYSSLSEQAKAILDNESHNEDNITKVLNSVVGFRTGLSNDPPTDKPVQAESPEKDNLYNGARWTSKSPRWRKKFQELLENPDQATRLVGCIRIPTSQESYGLRRGNSKTFLGLLVDGTEVAVTRVGLVQMHDLFINLKLLFSEEADHLFLVKYLAIEQHNEYCYLAKELCEYTLEEYVRILHLNRRLDPLCADRLVWQLLKGLKHLHDNCRMAHHNLRPTNILVDKCGKVKLADYGYKHSHLERNLSQTLPELDRRCWLPCEVLVSNSDACFSLKSDVQVAGMLIYYILSGGNHPFGKSPYEIEINICRNWHQLMYISEEANDMVLSMISYTAQARPLISEALRHPYFWSEEKRFRFLLIVGSDILKELKGGAVVTTVTDHVNIIYGPAVSADWISQIDPLLIEEMNSFRQYRNSIPELALFVYNCCLHFDKLSKEAREILNDPCRYFNTKFPTLFMAVYRMLRTSESVTTRKCYMSFF